jgi:hypothetical protein
MSKPHVGFYSLGCPTESASTVSVPEFVPFQPCGFRPLRISFPGLRLMIRQWFGVKKKPNAQDRRQATEMLRWTDGGQGGDPCGL